MTLRQKQSLFCRLLAELISWVFDQGWELTLGDGSIDRERRFNRNGHVYVGFDSQHMPGSLHYQRLAADLNLFVSGTYVSDGSHPAWLAIGAHWKAQNPLCAWGGDFTPPDANHVSVRSGGKA